MFGPLGQVTMLIGLTSGLRALGRIVGPRRSGLLIGLPSTTVVLLLGCGLEQGLEEAKVAAEACLAGLVAAATLPVVFARSVEAGWRLSRAVLAGVVGYAVVAVGLWWLPGTGPAGCVAGAVVGVVTNCAMVCGRRFEEQVFPPSAGPSRSPTRTLLVTRGGLPVLYVTAVRTLRWLAGPAWSGRFMTFPGGSLALLIATHLEEGPCTAGRLATAMPRGSFATLSFLAMFRVSVLRYGLGVGLILGYLAALLALVVSESLAAWSRNAGGATSSRAAVWIAVRKRMKGRTGWLRADPRSLRWFRPVRKPAAARKFAPGLECLA